LRGLPAFPARRSSDLLVAVVVGGADLRHHVRARLDHGDRDHPVVLVEDLGHPELRAQDPGDLPFGHQSKPYWMFTSTEAGRSMRSEEHTSELQSRFEL